ncbi:hypothetical protein JB92DRAFT_652982 [Gautieria morchelliformis]|nr:hypothetical protein JB92DRAFT_652982 [Gautieria morchelliformis]
MSTTSTPTHRGRGRGRGGLGKYLRARGRRGSGRPAEFSKRLRLEDEESTEEGSEDDEERVKYAKRQLVTNADRRRLIVLLERQRLADQEDGTSHMEEEFDDGIDHTLSDLPRASSTSKTRKNKTQTIEWDASMDQLKRDKEAAEAVWDLKSRFRKNQPRLAASAPKPSPKRDTRKPVVTRRVMRGLYSWLLSTVPKVHDSRHVHKPPDADTDPHGSGAAPATGKAEMEDFLDDLLS